MKEQMQQRHRQRQSISSTTSSAQILLILSVLFVSISTSSSAVVSTAFIATTRTRSSYFSLVKSHHDSIVKRYSDNNNDNEAKYHPMSKNVLSHAMLRVPNVNATLDYWINRGATLHSYNKRGESTETAFVGFQDSTFKSPSSPPPGPNDVNGDVEEETKVKRFSLEITSVPPKEIEEWSIGNVIQYFGLSMLLNFDLRSAAAGTKPSIPMNDYDPNEICIKSVASGPGDPLSRICLHVSPEVGLKETADFYTNVLGMEQVAVDENMVCLRYTGNVFEDEVEGKKRSLGGVSTTIIFTPFKGSGEEGEELKLDHGNCLDHFAIDTKSLDVAQQILKEKGKEGCIFMEPTAMFGTTLMGLEDPNGYKIYLVEREELR